VWLFFIPLSLFLWDFSASHLISPDAYVAYVKIPSLESNFYRTEISLISYMTPLKEPKSAEEVATLIAKADLTPKSKPNIYSLLSKVYGKISSHRSIAPTWLSLKREPCFDPLPFHANGTQLSWYSIFYSDFPYHWNHRRKNQWQEGATALPPFKKDGVQNPCLLLRWPSLLQYGYPPLWQRTQPTRHLPLFPHYSHCRIHESDTQTMTTFKRKVSAKMRATSSSSSGFYPL